MYKKCTSIQILKKGIHLYLYRSGRRSDCRSSDRSVARVCPDRPGRVVHRSPSEETQIQSAQSVRGQRDEVRLQLLHVFIMSFLLPTVWYQLSLCPLGGALVRPRKPQIALPWQPKAATSMLREMSHRPKKRPVENNWSDVTLLNNRMFSLLTHVILTCNQYDMFEPAFCYFFY